ncbi:Multi antimicrobial extrusion protein [Macleaya cordata]|uniref:Protein DETOXIFICATION n=1 Tax=Macleaya cordata TaxID=56857 RepID=A0A200R8N5_MACCD|nr:Multi antimicrobial extrusion protein [Macleaya cordata]
MDGPTSPLLTNKNDEPKISSFMKSVWEESKMIWYIAGPAILTSLFQYSLAFVTQTLVGHIGTIELAAVGLQNLVIAGIGFGIMLGLGSALETLCGQAYGAGKVRMLGIYMQRSWVILLTAALPLTLVNIFSAQILKLLGQKPEIADMAGKFAIWMTPELYAYALNFPIQKFLQAQSKVMAMAWISLGTLVFHIFLSWLCILKLDLGLVGAAVSLNLSWWVLVIAQLIYIFSGSCKDSWSGFSWLAFTDLVGFVWLSLASAVMLCLEYWFYMVLVIFAGLLKNAEVAVDAASIWCVLITFFPTNSSIFVRVSNELGAGRPDAAKFSVGVMVATALITQTTFVIIILITRNDFPVLFTDSKVVMDAVSKLALYLCISIFLCSVQPVLSGVAVGAGWQAIVAYVNIASYYLIGLPIGILLGFKFNFGLEGLWGGVQVGVTLQTIVLIIITLRTDWDKEVNVHRTYMILYKYNFHLPTKSVFYHINYLAIKVANYITPCHDVRYIYVVELCEHVITLLSKYLRIVELSKLELEMAAMNGSTSTYSAPLLTNKNDEPKSSSFIRDVWEESKIIWYIAGPAILTSLFQYSLAFVTQTLVGHIGTIELAAVGLQNLVIAGIGFGIMLGMGSALETLCGQAYGAGKLRMLGIYMQRSWVILLTAALPLTLVNIFGAPILKLLGQKPEIADMAGKFAIWMTPELYAYALNFPIQKFLQAQSKVMAMAWISLGTLVFHIFLSWLCILKLDLGLVGAAVSLNLSWWVLVIAQLIYIFSGSCKDSWSGFSWLAFTDLVGFVWLSLASAVMLCLEYWCYMVLIVLAGLLKNPEVKVDAASICMNIEGWIFMVPLGFIAAISVRVSNELGAGRPKAAKFSVWVMVATGLITQTTFVIIILITRKDFPALFTDSKVVMDEVSNLVLYLCISIFLGSVQPVLSGVAVGAGWQAIVAYVTITCYYLIGLPIGILLGFKFNYGLEGLWGGVQIGIALQTIILVVITWRTDWDKEASLRRRLLQGLELVMAAMDGFTCTHSSAPLLTNKNNEPSSSSSLIRDVWEESKIIWYIAGPAILTSLFQYSLAFVTQTLVGHIGTTELAGVGLQNLVIAGIGFGVMLGMGSALETLCGQAYGAGKLRMLGIYMQRSWVILLTAALPLTLVNIFGAKILKLLGQNHEIADMAGKFAIWMTPQLYAYALNFPIQKFLQAQSKVMAMTWISLGALVFHVIMSWLCILKLDLGLVGAAVSLNLSWWVLVIGQLIYIFSPSCKESWGGFSWLAFTDLIGFVWLSLASAVMLCLEYWYFMVLIVLAGLLENAEVKVDAAAIWFALLAFLYPLFLFLICVSVRVSNELGAGRPKAAKFSVSVMVSTALITQTTFVIIILITRKDFPALFTDSKVVMDAVSKLALYLCITVFLCSVQPILSGVAIGAGWQAVVAYVNIISYYLVGLPMGALLGFKFNFGLEGLWGGMQVGIALQTIILIVITLRTDWDKEVVLSKERVSDCVGSGDDEELIK